jgi:hypothetical protein
VLLPFCLSFPFAFSNPFPVVSRFALSPLSLSSFGPAQAPLLASCSHSFLFQLPSFVWFPLRSDPRRVDILPSASSALSQPSLQSVSLQSDLRDPPASAPLKTLCRRAKSSGFKCKFVRPRLRIVLGFAHSFDRPLSFDSALSLQMFALSTDDCLHVPLMSFKLLLALFGLVFYPRARHHTSSLRIDCTERRVTYCDSSDRSSRSRPRVEARIKIEQAVANDVRFLTVSNCRKQFR